VVWLRGVTAGSVLSFRPSFPFSHDRQEPAATQKSRLKAASLSFPAFLLSFSFSDAFPLWSGWARGLFKIPLL